MNYADASQLWQKSLSRLKTDLNETRFKTWFQNVKLHSAENGRLVLHTDDAFTVRQLRSRYATQLGMVVSQVFGQPYEIEIVTTGELGRYEKKMSSSKLNPEYTFDTFVVGQSNRFAHAASLAVAEDPGKEYNPLFIYGGVGLGKTHLMTAIAHYILDVKPDSNILFTTSENFTNEVIEAIARKKTMELRGKMRTVDVLLIDDVQFLSNKQATQEEFFHTFNALYAEGKQIVLSSDRHPNEIATLEERMRSRFLSGLVVDVQKPDFETRMAILLRMAELKGIEIGPGAVSYIAERVDTNIRELEGSLIRVNAQAQLENLPITEDLAERALRTIVMVRDKKRITPESIMDAVAEKYRVRREDLLSGRRSQDVAMPRQLAIYLTRELTDLSTTRIGSAFDRDHSTIMYACKRTAEMIASDSGFEKSVNDLIRAIREG